MAVHAIATIKGGQAKTTLATSLATAPSSWQQQRLLVELDPQGDGALILGIQSDPELAARRRAFGSALAGGRRPDLTALGYLPDGTTRYVAVDASVYAVQDPLALRRVLDVVRHGCTVIIDLPPQETNVTLLGMCASDFIVIPATEDELGLAGLARTVKFFRESVLPRVPDVRIAGVVPVRVRTGMKQLSPQLEASRSKMKKLAAALGVRILPGIRERQAVRSAQDAHETIWTHSAAVDTRADMYALIEALKKEEKRVQKKMG